MVEITHVPSIPDVVLKVMRFDLHDPASGSDKLQQIISHDKGVCSRLLKVANSAYYSKGKPVTQLKDAVTRLGLKTVKMMVIASSQKAYGHLLQHPVLRTYLHEWPLATAFVSLDLLRPLGVDTGAKDEIFITALLHRIGMTVLALNATDKYLETLDQFEHGQSSLHKVEDSVLQTNNLEVNAQVYNTWKIPASLTMPPMRSEDDIGSASGAERIVALASIVAKRLLGCHVIAAEDALQEQLLSSLGADPTILDAFDPDYLSNLREIPVFNS